MPDTSATSPRERQVQELIAAYLDAEAEERAPQAEAWLAEHPDFANELRQFLADHRRLADIGRPLREAAAAPSSVDQPTMLSGPSHAPASGTLGTIRYFGDYELIEEIARGGMGVVYKARQVKLKRTVAVKMILAGQLAGAEDVRRFHTEAQAAARLHHPNIVSIHEVGDHEGQHYFSMDFIEGESLAQRITRGPLPAKDAASLLQTVARAVAFAHIENVIHRDLKPANILLDRQGEPHVTDFGLAKHVAADEDGSAASLTATGQVLGTPSYMAPEQAAGKIQEIGPHSDVYSLGAVLYCALAGRPPFQAASTLDTLLQVLNREPVSPRALNPAVPRDLETICLKCLDKDPRKRYVSAQDLADELQRFLDGQPIVARPIGPAARGWRWCRRNPVVAGLSAALVLALIGSSIIFRNAASRATREANINKELMIQAGNLANEKTALAEKATKQERLTQRHLYSAHMHLALQEYKSNNLKRVRDLLALHVPGEGKDDLRSFDWRHLSWLTNREQKSLPLAPGEPAAGISISPNGRYVALGKDSNWTSSEEIRVWDLAAGKLVATITGKKDRINPPTPRPNQSVAYDSKERPDKVYQQPVFSADSTLFALVEWDNPMVWTEVGGGTRYGEYQMKSPKVVVWDLATMKPRATIPMPEYPRDAFEPKPYHIAISSKHVAMAYAQRGQQHSTLQIWDLPENDQSPVGPGRTLAKQELISGHAGIASIQFLPDGQTVAWASVFGNELALTTLAAEPKTTTLPVHPYGVAISPDGKYFASGVNLWNEPWGQPVVNLYEAATGKVLHTFPVAPGRNYVFESFIRFSPDSRTLAIGRGLSLEVWDIESKQRIGYIAHADTITGLGFTDNQTIFSVSQDNVARYWNAATQPGPDTISLGKGPVRKIRSYGIEMPLNTVSSIAIDPGGRFFATIWSSLPSGPETRIALLYDLTPGSEGKPNGELSSAEQTFVNPQRISFSRDGEWLAVTGEGTHEQLGQETFVQLWKVSRGEKGLEAKLHYSTHAPKQHPPEFPLPALSPSATKLAYPDCTWTHHKESGGTARGQERLRLHDIASGKSVQLPAGVADKPLVMFGAEPAPEVWFADSQGLIGFERWEGSSSGTLFSADGKRVFMVLDRHVTPWQSCFIAFDVQTHEVVSAFEMPTPPQIMVLSADGKTLATAHGDRTVQLWDVSEANLKAVMQRVKERAEMVRSSRTKELTEPVTKPWLVIPGLADHISAIALCPDGKTLATASGDRAIRLWDLVTGEERLTLEGHARDITSLVFTPDGRALISGDTGGVVKLWRAAPFGVRR